MKRRDFVRTMAMSGMAVAASDVIADLVAQTPPATVLESRFKGLSDVALAEARRLGCSYADIRFTRSSNLSVNARGGNRDFEGFGQFGGGGGRGGRGGRGGGRGFGGFGGGSGAAGPSGAAGFGVRVIHSGVWGFASSPLVTEDEVRRIARLATDVARASAIAKKADVRLAPVPAYTDYWAVPIRKDPSKVPHEERQALVQKVVDTAMKTKDVTNVNASVQVEQEWKYFASTEGSYIEQEVWTTTPSFTVTARKDGETRSRTFTGVPMTGGWEVAEQAGMVENAERIAAEAVEFCTARPVEMGVKDLVLTPSHAMLTIHEIVGHATELDRILGYEANYAGTSFIRLSDVGKLKYGSRLFNVTADRNIPGGIGTVGYDDDGVKTQQWPLVREGILVGLQTNRESAHFIGEKESRGCTSASSWRDYPFLRMPNVHVDAGPPGSPTPEEIIADTRDGVLIDGRGSYSIDQQRYNGQFGGNAFWEIRNGRKTRMVGNVTYNAITTDFWGKLDAVSGRESWEMYGTGGDAKGQPTQTNSISHGSPWLRIRKVLVGTAYA
ncbi:MAG TPA: TldD/PmbA family protein [Vicinamibacterales bacterium]|nr:TldD/PmbA family protein [Vicinamibacterales bacterium]